MSTSEHPVAGGEGAPRLTAEECLERIRGVISRLPKEAWEHTDPAWHTDIWWALHTVDALTYEASAARPGDGQ